MLTISMEQGLFKKLLVIHLVEIFHIICGDQMHVAFTRVGH
jgi:hypothetical protein